MSRRRKECLYNGTHTYKPTGAGYQMRTLRLKGYKPVTLMMEEIVCSICGRKTVRQVSRMP